MATRARGDAAAPAGRGFRSRRGFRLAVFDCDGTLVDTVYAHVLAWRDRRLNFDAASLTEIVEDLLTAADPRQSAEAEGVDLVGGEGGVEPAIHIVFHRSE